MGYNRQQTTMKHKLLTLFLALAASVGTLFAQSGTCGDNLTWTLDTESGILTISGTGAMTNYTYSSNAPWYSYRTSIKTVIIEDGVTSIGSYAFYNCTGLTSIEIPNSVTSIGEYAFSGCKSLTSITIPNSVTSIGYFAFSYCSSLTSLTIPNSVTSIGIRAFDSCSSLTSITIPNSVTTIGDGAFDGCSSLTSITIPNSVTSIGYQAFYNCSSLTSITIPNSVTSIGDWAFSGCSKLTSITVDSENPNYCDIDGVLFNKNKTTLIRYPEGKSATSYTIPNSVTSIGWSAFAGCSSLTSITIPNSVTSIGDNAFAGCSSLTSITIPNSVTSIGNNAFYNCTGLTSVTIPNSVTTIGEGAFYYCSTLTSITIPNSVTSIGDWAFSGCSSLTSITCEAVVSPTLGGNEVFYDVDKSIPLYVPAQSIDLYKAADQWKNFTNILPIPDVEPQKFTITWQDEDGNVIKTDQVAQGTTPAFTGTTPTKPATNEYTYEFAGWLPKIQPATKDMYYTTFFERNKIETPVYTVNINGENCSLNINNQYPEGTVITVEAVADECFEFQQWSDGNKDNPRTVTVTKDMSLTAEFNKVRYTVTGEPSTGGKVQIRKQ